MRRVPIAVYASLLLSTGVTVSLKKPALDPASLPASNASMYPEPFRARVLPREKRSLGDACGLTRIGVSQAVLMPGKESSMRHWHTHEDEFIYVLEGEVVLKTEAGEQTLRAGMCAGFKAGVEDGHQFINRSGRPAVFLAISNRDPQDVAHYPDVDLRYNGAGAAHAFAHKDGSEY